MFNYIIRFGYVVGFSASFCYSFSKKYEKRKGKLKTIMKKFIIGKVEVRGTNEKACVVSLESEVRT